VHDREVGLQFLVLVVGGHQLGVHLELLGHDHGVKELGQLRALRQLLLLGKQEVQDGVDYAGVARNQTSLEVEALGRRLLHDF